MCKTGRINLADHRHTNRVYVDSCVFGYTFDVRDLVSEICLELGIKFQFKA